MTAPEELLDPQQQAFADADPTVLREPEPASLTPVHHELAAAIIVVCGLVATYLLAHRPADPAEALRSARTAWQRYAPLWLRLSVPAIRQAYLLGKVSGLSPQELEDLATDYAATLGEFLDTSSADALAEGFNTQLAARWSSDLAWHRASTAYGLDRTQMRSYVRALMAGSDGGRVDPVPTAARMAVDKALLTRADRIGADEAFSAMQGGRAVAWLYLYQTGQLPTTARRMWITNHPEHDCAICGPLHETQVRPDEPFLTSDGRHIWAPRAHPHCECGVVLVDPGITKADTTQERRDDHGRWVKIGAGVAGAALLAAGGYRLVRRPSMVPSAVHVPAQPHRPPFGENFAVLNTRNSDVDYTWTRPDHDDRQFKHHQWLIGQNEWAVDGDGRQWRLRAEGFHAGRGDNGGTHGRPVRYVVDLQGDVGDDLGLKLIRAHSSPEHQTELGRRLDTIFNDSYDIRKPMSDADVRALLGHHLDQMHLPPPTREEHLHAERLMRGEADGTAASYQLPTNADLADEEAKHHGHAVLRGRGTEQVAKDMNGDSYDRDTHGRFAVIESRRHQLRPVIERNPLEDILAQIEATEPKSLLSEKTQPQSLLAPKSVLSQGSLLGQRTLLGQDPAQGSLLQQHAATQTQSATKSQAKLVAGLQLRIMLNVPLPKYVPPDVPPTTSLYVPLAEWLHSKGLDMGNVALGSFLPNNGDFDEDLGWFAEAGDEPGEMASTYDFDSIARIREEDGEEDQPILAVRGDPTALLGGYSDEYDYDDDDEILDTEANWGQLLPDLLETRGEALENSDEIIAHLDTAGLRRIYWLAGYDRHAPVEEIRAYVSSAAHSRDRMDASLKAAFADYITFHTPQAAGDAGKELADKLSAMGIEDIGHQVGKVHQMLIFDQGLHAGTTETSSGIAALHGRYGVNKVQYRSNLGENGEGAKPGLVGWSEAHVVPIAGYGDEHVDEYDDEDE